ncbi:MAG: 4Fe-4S dicluster domain-containing protein [bacterium]|nr:4Fe-4S dicluster domain-containing protein [bacterium]
MQKRLVVDLDYCIGCKSCSSACKLTFKGENRIVVSGVETVAYLPLACRHCEDALCLRACPKEAISKDKETGIVSRSSFKCVGCTSCIYACPFGVLDSMLLRHIPDKCNLCKGDEDGPNCVSSCPTGALKFLTDEEITKVQVGKQFVSRLAFWRRK